MSGLSGVVQMAKVDEKLVYDFLDDIDTLPQHWNDVIPLERLSLSKRYAIGWLTLGSSSLSVMLPSPKDR